MKISNPVLPGFNADPSMIRVGDTYYIANSTFDWWPGVRLHESRDMVHWNLLPGPLNCFPVGHEGQPVWRRHLGA